MDFPVELLAKRDVCPGKIIIRFTLQTRVHCKEKAQQELTSCNSK